jgi:hypothetical protein
VGLLFFRRQTLELVTGHGVTSLVLVAADAKAPRLCAWAGRVSTKLPGRKVGYSEAP